MFKRILIANRGEIACRIIKTAQRMGVETVAVYSSADRNSLHVELADVAICIGHAAASESYLNIQAIIQAALESHAEAIHPGYGFLSENPQFAQACIDADIIFIGPSVSAMEVMASKQLAKQLLEKTSTPLTPGYHGTDQSDKRLLKEAQQLGFPILLKAANGGGGKGMRAVYNAADFSSALTSARRESKASFSDDTMLIEKLIVNPRHIEIQIIADHHGHVVHLFERDCSIQRRHQKIIEEAPAPNVSNALRKKIAQAAIHVAQAIDYRGAGTVEFLLDSKDNFYFMEMNTRLQVEHPVTEMITGFDLVEWQLRIAANEPLSFAQNQIKATGHAIECRIYAEDPSNSFLPSIGQLHFLQEPLGDGIRVDTGVCLHSEISRHYDPMIAKLIAWGKDRNEALQRMQQALKHYHIGGVKTNIPFLQAIFQHSDFVKGQYGTDFLTQNNIEILKPDHQFALLMAASFDYLKLYSTTTDPLHMDTFAWQMHSTQNDRHWCARYLIDGEQKEVFVIPINQHELILKLSDHLIKLRATLINQQLSLEDGYQVQHALIEQYKHQLILYTAQGAIVTEQFLWQNVKHGSGTKNQLTAPMPATVVAILKHKGEFIKAGEQLMVLEAMKMEHTICAPEDGTIIELFYEVGAQVNEGAELGRIQKTNMEEEKV